MIVEENLKVGTVIELDGKRNKEFTKEGILEIKRKYKVIQVYKHHVLLEDTKIGVRRSITNAELLQMGLVNQASEISKWKKKGKSKSEPATTSNELGGAR